jgi:hypothetical protein
MGKRLKQIPESLLAKLWQARAARHRHFTTLDGRRVHVLYPGRLSSAAGPDFRDALIRISGGGLVKGDVEIHRRQRDWRDHGHHRDPNYDGVVLHAALKIDEAAGTLLASGESSPVVSLEPLLSKGNCGGPGTEPWVLPSRHGYRRPKDADGLGRLLDRAGDQRFVQKARRLGNGEPSQVLYEALMEALGYSRNKEPFREMARRLPYARLQALAGRYDATKRLNMISKALFRASEGLRWHTFRVRPSNHPRRRLLGAARMLARHMQRGLREGLARAVHDGSWRAVLDGLEVRDAEGKSLIGRGRASDMALNAVLPFFHARGRLDRDPSLRDISLRIYRAAPRLQENELTHEMRRLLVPSGWEGQVNSARRQQGLIHLYQLLTKQPAKA